VSIFKSRTDRRQRDAGRTRELTLFNCCGYTDQDLLATANMLIPKSEWKLIYEALFKGV
jgi:hypothetical protein